MPPDTLLFQGGTQDISTVDSVKVELRKQPGRRVHESEEDRGGATVSGACGVTAVHPESKVDFELELTIAVDTGKFVLHPKLKAPFLPASFFRDNQDLKRRQSGNNLEAAAAHSMQQQQMILNGMIQRWKLAQSGTLTDITIIHLPSLQLKLHFGASDSYPKFLDARKASVPVDSTHLSASTNLDNQFASTLQVPSVKRSRLCAFFGILFEFLKPLPSLKHCFPILFKLLK